MAARNDRSSGDPADDAATGGSDQVAQPVATVQSGGTENQRATTQSGGTGEQDAPPVGSPPVTGMAGFPGGELVAVLQSLQSELQQMRESLNPRPLGSDAAVSRGPNRGTASAGGAGDSSGISASEALGIAARAGEPHIASYVKDSVIPFDPDRTEMGAKLWMQRLEQYLGVIGLERLEARKILLLSKLKGRSSLWYESTGEGLSSWRELRESFLSEFVDALAVERAWFALSRIKDTSSFEKYWRAFEKCARKTEENIWTHDRVRGMFYYGLAGRRKERLLSHALTLGSRIEDLSLKCMVDFLQYLERAYVSEGEPRTTKKVEKEQRPEGRKAKAPGACFLCGKTDHWKRSCPLNKTKVAAVNAEDNQEEKKDRPELCRVYAEELYSPQEKVSDIKPLQLIVESSEQLNKRALKRNARTAMEQIGQKFKRGQEMVVDVRVGEQTVKALIDTGATRSCMNAELARKARLEIVKEPLRAKLANQSEMKIEGKAEARVYVLGKELTAGFLVCELGNPERPLILGRDVLREVGVVITLGKDGEEIVQLEGHDKLSEEVDNDGDDNQVEDEEVAATEAEISEQVQAHRERSSDETTELPAEFQEYADVFGPLPDSPPLEREKHDLHIELEGPLPNAVRQYRLTATERDEMRRQVKELKESGLIRPSQSSFTSPILFVPKKTGERRMCIDFRKLNAVTKTVPNSLPLIEDILDNLHGKAVFTTLDLRSGYWQLAVGQESRYLTAFQADGETWEWNVVPFGLKNAPTVFQQFMKSVVQGISSAHVYLDDIVIASTTREENIRDVCRVLQRLRDNHLRCKLSKCDFFKREIDYLGHRVSDDGLQVQAAKVEAVEKAGRPTSIQALRSFLGLTGYYRRFIQNYGGVAKPLTDLLRKGVKFAWGQDQEQAYAELKRRISSAPVLALPDPAKDYVLTTDASDAGLGAVLSQDNRPIAFYSKRLNPAQSRYTTGEKELLAIVSSLEHFRHLVDGKKIVVQTDHKNLVSALTREKLNARLVRAIVYLQQYDVVLRYIDGKSNHVADYLSRYPVMMASLAVFELSHHNFEDIVRETEGDAEAQGLEQRKQGEKKNGILYINGRAFVPKGIRARIVGAHHDGAHAGHRGVVATLERIRRSFYWPGMEADVREHIQRCEVCQTTKANNSKPLGLTRPLELPSQRFQQISVDFITHLPASGGGKDSILVIVDSATKYAAFVPVKSTDTASKIAETVLTQWVLKGFGIPREIISDRDPKFTSKLWKNLMERLGVQLKMSSSNHPQTDGQSERTIRTLNEYLRAYARVSGKDWLKFVPFAEFAYNDATNLTGYSPYQLLHGQNPELPWQMIIPGKTEMEEVNDFCARMQNNIQRALYTLERSRMKTAQRVDQGRRIGEYQVGEQVYVNTRLFKTSLPGVARFKPTFIGPFEIKKKLGNSYEVDMKGEYNMHPVFNTTELKLAKGL